MIAEDALYGREHGLYVYVDELERFMEQSSAIKKKTATRDMTTGNIAKEIMLFALPLMFGKTSLSQAKKLAAESLEKVGIADQKNKRNN